MSDLIVQDKRSAAIEAAQPISTLTPMQELQMQIVRTGDLEKLKELRQLEKEWREDQAKQSFNAAFAAFKGEAVKILRTKEITDGPLKGKKHAELGEIVKAVTPALSKHGLSISWRLSRDEKDWMEVSCTLRHIDGHSESVSMGGAPDAGPGRNAIQARGSAKTYLERYTATAILGLAPEDEDADGTTTKSIAMDESTFDEWMTIIKESGSIADLQKGYFDAQKHAEKLDDKVALKKFAEAKNERYKVLARSGGAR